MVDAWRLDLRSGRSEERSHRTIRICNSLALSSAAHIPCCHFCNGAHAIPCGKSCCHFCCHCEELNRYFNVTKPATKELWKDNIEVRDNNQNQTNCSVPVRLFTTD